MGLSMDENIVTLKFTGTETFPKSDVYIADEFDEMLRTIELPNGPSQKLNGLF